MIGVGLSLSPSLSISLSPKSQTDNNLSQGQKLIQGAIDIGITTRRVTRIGRTIDLKFKTRGPVIMSSYGEVLSQPRNQELSFSLSHHLLAFAPLYAIQSAHISASLAIALLPLSQRTRRVDTHTR